MKFTGRREVAESVLTAALTTAAVRVIHEIADYLEEKRRAKKKARLAAEDASPRT